LKTLLHTTTSAILAEEAREFKITKLVAFGLSFPKYTIMSDEAKLISLQYYRKPTIEMAQKLWNLQEHGAIREFSKITYDSIKTNKKIYLPPDGVINNKTDIFFENPHNICVRILYNKKLRIFQEGESMMCCVTGNKEPEYIDTVILHMHGGGFIALSSRSMQIYTRKWANELDVPIFSVDYRMPPDHPFPAAPYDCLVAYQFLLHHVHKFMNIRPTNIILAGDSAGGNLALSTTALILKNKLPPPKGIYSAYPPTDMRMMFSESRMNAITDVLLWPTTLLLCLKQYLQEDPTKAEDPLASPALLTEEYVSGAVGNKRFPQNWPKTIITVGTKDPLYDDSLMLMQKMVDSNVNCRCIVYEDMSHGYLNTELIIDEAKKTVKQSILHLTELLNEIREVAREKQKESR
jgi:hormone-sensitive lipase